MGKRPRKSDLFTAQEEELLWEKVLGKDNPTSLNYTIFFLASQHFCTKGRQEHHQLQIEDLKETRDPVSAKLQQSNGLKDLQRRDKVVLTKCPRMVTHRTGGQRCPATAYEMMVSKMPTRTQKCGTFVFGTS